MEKLKAYAKIKNEKGEVIEIYPPVSSIVIELKKDEYKIQEVDNAENK